MAARELDDDGRKREIEDAAALTDPVIPARENPPSSPARRTRRRLAEWMAHRIAVRRQRG